LRQRMIDDMMVRNFAPNTIVCYLKQVSYFAQHFGRSPDRLGPEEIRRYQIYLAKERNVGISSRTVAVSALRFLYHVTLKQDRVALRHVAPTLRLPRPSRPARPCPPRKRPRAAPSARSPSLTARV
jgi:hypothetical protein